MEYEIPHLQRYARSLTHDESDADDLVQDCLERALSHLGQFEYGTDLRGWLFTILRNAHIDKCRKAARRGPHIPLENWQHEAQRRPTQEDRIEVNEIEARIRQLRPCDQQVMMLSVFAGLKHERIAERLDIAVGTVKSRLSRARRSLQDAHLSH